MFERLKKFLRGKADPGGDPRTSSGWELLSGIPNSAAGGWITSGWTTSGEIWAKKLNINTRALEALSNQQSAVWACVRRLCLAAQEAPPRIGIETPDGWTDLPDHPLQALLDVPNPMMSYAELLNHSVMHLQLTGRSWIWKWRNRAGYVNELWPMPTSWVSPNPEKGGYEIWQGPNKPTVLVKAEDLVNIFYPDPSSLTRALGPLQAALRDALVDEARQDYQMELLANNKRPGMILYQPDEWSEEQKTAVRSAFLQSLGDGGRGKTMFMQGEGAKVEPIPPVGELDWPGLTGLSETRICSCFGVPPIVAGMRAGLEHATYSNYEQALQAFYEGTMVGLWKMLDAGLTRGLLTNEGETDGAEIYHDTTAVKGLNEDADKRATRAAGLFAGGLATRNEAREMAGMESLDVGGDIFVLPANMIETPAAQLGTPQETPPKDTGVAGVSPVATPALEGKEFDPNQPRDRTGEWTAGGGADLSRRANLATNDIADRERATLGELYAANISAAELHRLAREAALVSGDTHRAAVQAQGTKYHTAKAAEINRHIAEYGAETTVRIRQTGPREN